MCILIHHPANATFESGQLEDFFSKNPDGFGAIVKHGDTVEVLKSIGTLAEIQDLYERKVSGREAIIHFRMKTHGAIDLANCHPYEVTPGLWMAHNGILHTGNHKDTRMSDTYHYIQDFLRPLIEHDPDILFQPAFQKLVASHIGNSNKFAFMNGEGETVIINEASGVEHKGIWYSNTYAWTPHKFGLGQAPAPYKPYQAPIKPYAKQDGLFDDRYASSSTWKSWNAMEKQMATEPPKKSKRKRKETVPQRLTTEQLKPLIRSTYNAINLDSFVGVKSWVEQNPMAAMRFIYEIYGSERNKKYSANAISNLVNHNPGAAADMICEIWEDMEPDLCELAGIQQQGLYPL